MGDQGFPKKELTMIKKFASFIVLALALAGCDAVEGDSDYRSLAVFQGLSQEQQRYIINMERYVFQPGQDIYYGLNTRQIDVRFLGTLKDARKLLSFQNDSIRTLFWAHIVRWRKPHPYNLHIEGVPSFSTLKGEGYSPAVEKFLADNSRVNTARQTIRFKEEKCLLHRVVDERGAIVAAAVLLEFDNTDPKAVDKSKPVITCIIRGHLYLYGMSNVAAVPEELLILEAQNRGPYGASPAMLPYVTVLQFANQINIPNLEADRDVDFSHPALFGASKQKFMSKIVKNYYGEILNDIRRQRQ